MRHGSGPRCPHGAGRGRGAAPRAAAIAAAAVALALAAGCSRPGAGALAAAGAAPSPAAAPADAVAMLHNRCVDDMVRQVCRVMSGPEAAAVPEGTVVFVAGLGPVQAQVYNELRASGDGMCRTVSRHCTEDWDGAPCRTARSLYGS